MGEIADLMIDGEICEGCGCELGGEAPGYPRRCRGCQKDLDAYKAEAIRAEQPKKPANPMPKVRCPRCNKAVSARGIPDHLHQVHGYDK